jgi:hypothetical protein
MKISCAVIFHMKNTVQIGQFAKCKLSFSIIIFLLFSHKNAVCDFVFYVLIIKIYIVEKIANMNYIILIF